MSTLDQQCINTIRILAADTVEKSKSGHPGAPMGLAVVAHTLWKKMNFNPMNLNWINRDRFVLSNGHACALQYIMLYLTGCGLELEDLKNFRQIDSKTPGHPENHTTPGVEVTTGPLGQGFANGVGIAIAQQNIKATYDKEGGLFNSLTYVVCGDGCLQEGVCCEAASLAGHLQLGNLIVIYDDNKIQIDGDTALAFTEDVDLRFKALGWHVQSVDNGDTIESMDKIIECLDAAKNKMDQPSIIRVRTTIGFGSKNQGKEKTHGSPLGAEDIVELKKKWGFDSNKHFQVPSELKQFYDRYKVKGNKLESDWNVKFQEYKKQNVELAKELESRIDGKLPENLLKLFPDFKEESIATRKTSEMILNAIVPNLPQIIGGSADLTGSNLTRWRDAVDFQHPSTKLGNYAGRYIRFGVREHCMAAICNGISGFQPLPNQTNPHDIKPIKKLTEARVGFFIPFASTFLNFITYAYGAVRLSALSGHQVIYIMTHDSIGLGEDGPTHQPIETLALLRATPNCSVWRPADGNETSASYVASLLNTHTPTVLALSRQNLPQLKNSSIEDALKGAYIINPEISKPVAIIVATGSEVSLSLGAADFLYKSNIPVRVVSMPSIDYFEHQDQAYKMSIFPKDIPIISVEVMSTLPWAKYAHSHIGIDTFGASGPISKVYEKFGFTIENISKKVNLILAYYDNKPVPYLFDKP